MTSIFRRASRVVGTILCLSVVAAAAAACPTAVPARVPLGNWGGPNAGMVVSDSGAEVQYACASGRITAPLLLNSHGDFNLPGLYIRTGPGPVPVNDSLVPKFPARYTGHTDGKAMSFTMSGDSVPTQSYDLTFGGNPNVMRCL
ncbi:MAG: hypothetical protein ACRENQ_05240 [Gemmatimonadaceae bacterium]